MSGATPTLIPKDPLFPLLLPKPPQPHPIPLQKRRIYTNINPYRDLQREMDDLSDEDNELEDLGSHVRNRGYTFLVPIGRNLTRQEEKNDQGDDDDDDSGGSQSPNAPSPIEEDPENESNQDLDASMEDLDEEPEEGEEGDVTGETENTEDMGEGDEDNEEYEEEPASDLSIM